ncbi:hypothetical protein A2U01_0085565, partial [Trifolium medium]|nr:hypothetical protein [Trifolium medium]
FWNLRAAQGVPARCAVHLASSRLLFWQVRAAQGSMARCAVRSKINWVSLWHWRAESVLEEIQALEGWSRGL